MGEQPVKVLTLGAIEPHWTQGVNNGRAITIDRQGEPV